MGIKNGGTIIVVCSFFCLIGFLRDYFIEYFDFLGGKVMKKEIMKTQINVNNNIIGVMKIGNIDYISLTD